MPEPVTLAALLAQAAAAHPDRVAVAVDGGDRLTYGAWEARSDALARRLAGEAVGAGDRVALVFDAAAWCDYAVGYLAVHKVGAVAVPLPAGAGDTDLARALRDCDASAMVAPAGLAPPRDAVPLLDPADHAPPRAGAAVSGRAPASPVAEILYAVRPLSGAFAVARTHADLLGAPSWAEGSGPGDRPVLHAFPPGSVTAQDALVSPLVAAPTGCLVLPAFDAGRFCALAAEGRARASALDAAAAQALLESGAPGRHDLSGLTRLVLTSARTSRELLEALAAAFPRAVLVAGRAPADDPPGPAALEACAPIAPSQEGMLWHEQLAPGCQNLPGLARRLRGPLDVGALARALDEIVRRHEPLRTTFALHRGQVRQAVRAHRGIDLVVEDLSGLDPDERDAEVSRRVSEAGARPFDLTSDAVFQPTLLRLAATEHVLVVRTHHSVFDDWSVGVFRRQLAALYTAFADGRPSPLPAPTRSFGEFARDQHRRLAGQPGAREQGFWRRELAGAALATQLPVDDPQRPVGSAQAAATPVSLVLPPALVEQLRTLVRGRRMTVFMGMLAAYGILVHRYTAQDDLLLATVVANRNRTDLEGLVGCFTKKVPLRLRLGGDPSFAEAMTRTRTALMGALSHQDLAFDAVVQDALGAPAAAHGLVPHVALVFQGETPREEVTLPGLQTSGFETSASTRRAHYMAAADERPTDPGSAVPWGGGLYRGGFVIVSVADADGELSCVARGAFHAPAVAELLDRYRTLLADAVADPSRPASQLRLHDGRARDEVLARGRGAPQPLPAANLDDAFLAQLGRTPHAPAVRTPTATMTYADLDRRADRLAQRLQAQGVGPGATVAIALDPSPQLVVAALGAWKAGAAWMALAPWEDRSRLDDLLARTPVDAALGEDGHGALRAHTRVVEVDTDDLPSGAGRAVPVAVGADADAVVFHGAGPSAVPDAVTLDHGCLLNLAAGWRAIAADGASGPRGVCLPPATGAGFVHQLLALLDGHTLCLPEPSSASAAQAVVDLVRGGVADLVDAALDEVPALLDAGLQDAIAGRQGPVEPVLVVGVCDPVSPEAWRRLRALAGAQVLVVYGPAECAFGATLARVAEHARPVIGRPLPGVTAHVLDAHGQPAPSRAPGELHLGGRSLAAVPRTGTGQAPADRAPWGTGRQASVLADGTIELLGRTDAASGLRGFRVDTDRIASALQDCPGVHDVHVSLEVDDREEPQLVARVTPDGAPPTLATLRVHLWARLPGYAWPSVLAIADAAGVTAATRSAPDGTAEAHVLASLWADARGVEHVAPSESYSQRFSFLEALGRARAAGLAVTGAHVARNRTVETLAVDLAASRAAGRDHSGPPGPPA